MTSTIPSRERNGKPLDSAAALRCNLLRLRKDLRHLRDGRCGCQGDGGKWKRQPWQRGRVRSLLPSTSPISRWQRSFPGSCYWSSRSIGTQFPRETLYLTTFFCVGIIYSTSPSDAYRIFEWSVEVAVFCFAPVIKSQY